MTFITSDPIAPYRHALNAWASPLATCALPKGVCYLLTYLRGRKWNLETNSHSQLHFQAHSHPKVASR